MISVTRIIILPYFSEYKDAEKLWVLFIQTITRKNYFKANALPKYPSLLTLSTSLDNIDFTWYQIHTFK